jgi:hypothetical protein
MPLHRLRSDLGTGIAVDNHNIKTKTANYTVLTDDEIILGNGTITITLPAVAGAENKTYIIKNIHATLTVTVATTGAATIDGAATVDLSNQYDAISVVTDGSNWFIVWNKT